MKKLQLLVIVGLLFTGFAFAHPGNTYSNGYHTCYTNCAAYGLVDGEYHNHPKTITSYAGYAPAGSCGDEKDSYLSLKQEIDVLAGAMDHVYEDLVKQYEGTGEGDKYLRAKAARITEELRIQYNDKVRAFNAMLDGYKSCMEIVGMQAYDEKFRLYEESIKQIISDYLDSKQSCSSLYGSNSVEIGDDKCSCKVGYSWNANKTECIITSSKVKDINNNDIDNLELKKAIQWMYDNKLTSYNTVETFMGDEYITREQASKFFVMFANTLGQRPDSIKTNKFIDIENSDPNLYPYICVAYSLGIINGHNNKFMPFDRLTPAQSLAMLIRITDGKLNEQGTNRYAEYYNHANSDGILNGLGFSLSNLDTTNIKRKDMALLLYRAR